MASATSCSEENFSCSICLDVFNRPVTTPCGHNFCRTCINTYWDDQVQFKCPLCNEVFLTRPDVRVNTLLSEMVDQYRRSVPVKEFDAQQMIQERRKKIQEINDTVDRSKAQADRELANGQKVLTALKRRIDTWNKDLHQTVKEKLKATEHQAEGLIKELRQEIEDLTNRSSEVKKPQHTRDWTTVEVHPPSYVGTLRRSLDQLEETLNMELKKVPDLRSTPREYACELTLDPNTAYRYFSLSDDNRKVTRGTEDQSYPDHPERFFGLAQLLCREVLTGRCYWEVEWKGVVSIAVTYRGIPRKKGGKESGFGMNNQSWRLYCHDGGYSAQYNNVGTVLPPPPAGSNRVGVYLDRPAGILSFYTVSPDVGGSSQTLTHIHTFRSTFTQEDLLPGFDLWPGASLSLL